MSQFRTSNLALAATLLHQKCRLIELARSPTKTEFIFEDSPALHETVRGYWQDDLLLPAQSLLASLRRAKHVLLDYQQP